MDRLGRTPYTRFLPRQARKELNVPKLKSSYSRVHISSDEDFSKILGLVELIDAKGIGVAQPIWP